MPNVSWDQLYMKQAFAIAEGSKDPSTKVGAVIADKNNGPVSQGYNGFPKGCDESKYTWDRPLKYLLVLHAERNAMIHAKRDLDECKIYVTHHPCEDCLKQILAEGITEIVYEDDSVIDRFSEDQLKAIEIMKSANEIKIRKFVHERSKS